jgi:hypothetical protein
MSSSISHIVSINGIHSIMCPVVLSTIRNERIVSFAMSDISFLIWEKCFLLDIDMAKQKKRIFLYCG